MTDKENKEVKAEEVKKEAVTPDSVVDNAGKVISGTDNNTNMVLCWIFAPITSLIWMNDADEDLKWHAKTTLYWGLVSIAFYIVMFVLGTILSLFVVGIVCFCFMGVFSLLDLVVRVMGAIKAGNGERYEVPVVSGWVK